MSLTGKQVRIRINSEKSPWFGQTAVVLEETKQDGFLVEFDGGHQRYVSGTDFCLEVVKRVQP